MHIFHMWFPCSLYGVKATHQEARLPFGIAVLGQLNDQIVRQLRRILARLPSCVDTLLFSLELQLELLVF